MNNKLGKEIKYIRDISEYFQKFVTEDKIKEVLNVVENVRKCFEENNINE